MTTRCPSKVISQGNASLEITLKFNQNIGTEGFRITDSGNGGIVVIGNDELGLLYGLGKLLRTSFYSEDGFTLGSWRGESIPEKPIRGIYFASHFGNYYHVAPIKEVKQYVEELGLWGINSILIGMICTILKVLILLKL